MRNQSNRYCRAGQQDQLEDAQWRIVRGPNLTAYICLFGIGILCYAHHSLVPLLVMVAVMILVGLIGGLLHLIR
jgi:hypothetical protein